jgi:glucokinase
MQNTNTGDTAVGIASSAQPAHTDDSTHDHLPLVVAVDLGGTQIRAAVLRGATLLSRIGLLTGENPTPERIIPRIFGTIEEALSKANVTLKQVAGIGIGAPGPLDSKTGIVFAPPNLAGWNRVPLRDIFIEHFQVPIFVENDANAAGLGEYIFGAGKGSTDMVYMTVSTGIGGGVMIDGKIMEGASGTAAELGHMTIDWHGERCPCGNIGCLEYIASGTSIARKANAAIHAGQGDELLAFALNMQQQSSVSPGQTSGILQTHAAMEEHDDLNGQVHTTSQTSDGPIHVNARTVGQAAEAGIPLAQTIIQEAAEAIGVGLVNIIHVFNPQMIILGGGVMQMGNLLMEPARRIVQERAMKVPRDAVRIVQAQLGPNVGLVGAGALIYYHQHHEQL